MLLRGYMKKVVIIEFRTFLNIIRMVVENDIDKRSRVCSGCVKSGEFALDGRSHTSCPGTP